ncbi:hypothetical protein [Melittangium boletus]|uniref:Uncharacterized protein n=1 Tax=Melittangium boletus DSM 14713 TaxID=1294270 RepID=A0A250I9M3_9BACT|nr:hypothetical protein [Melittangium boletus]ATB28574.1 hypothetical protein MEBOL_002023 [Melittangium boletus DSM 14713]
MPSLPRLLILTAAVLLAPGCRKIADTFFVVTAETDELCKAERGLTFSGDGTDTLTHTVIFPLGQMGTDLPEGHLETELRVRLFELDVMRGEVDLKEDLQVVKVSLRRRGATEFIRTLLEQENNASSQAFTPTRLVLRAVEAASVPELARDEQVEMVLEARTRRPLPAWTADLQVCASLRAEVHYFHLIY